MKTLVLPILLFVALLLVPVNVSAQPARDSVGACSSEMNIAQLETRGDELRRLKQYDEAIKCFGQATRKNPRSPDLQNKIGISYLMLADYRNAELYFQRAHKLDRNSPHILNNLGAVAYVSRNYGKAINYYKKSLALDETNASAHSNLGTAWFAQRKLERAIAEYTRAIELDPDIMTRTEQGGVTARIVSVEERAKYMYLLAKLYAKRGDAERCFQCLRKAKEEGYRKINEVYVDEEFASLRQDPRLGQIVPPQVR